MREDSEGSGELNLVMLKGGKGKEDEGKKE